MKGVVFRAFLYAVALFFTPWADKLGPMLYEGRWPNLPMVAGCALSGIVGASIGLRAFFDGSDERRQQREQNGKVISGDTTTKTKVVDSDEGPVKVTSETSETTKVEPTKET